MVSQNTVHTRFIVVPPAVEDNWEWTISKFRLDNENRIITEWQPPQTEATRSVTILVIVDEAHKFRNDTAEAFDQLQRICKTPVKHPDGTASAKKVILVSATPLQQSRPRISIIRLALFQDLKDSTLSISNLQHFFAQREKEYRQAHKQADVEAARKQVKDIYELIRTKVISEVIVRRTRTDLIEHEQYKKDLDRTGSSLPQNRKATRHLLSARSCSGSSIRPHNWRLLSDPERP